MKSIGSRLVQPRHQVPVSVERRGDRGMAEPILEHFHVDALGDEQGGVGVPEVMHPERLAD